MFKLSFACLAVLSIAAAALPLTLKETRSAETAQPPAWPSQLEGRPLMPLALSAREESFLAGFPGAVRRYTDSDREVIVRWVTHASRRLHPAADCYRAMGYDVGDVTVERSQRGVERRCFAARRTGSTQRVCEQITDAA